MSLIAKSAPKGAFSVTRNYQGRLCGVSMLAMALSVSGLGLLTSSRAEAQNQPDGGSVTVLDTIYVTARKRDENPQDVPISMTLLSAERLQDVSPATSNAGLSRLSPNFNFVDSGGQFGNTANIRGVGSFVPVSTDDTSVVFYVDEMPQSVYGIAPNLLDTERVEILRGPQGTLFGRNSQGGAVNIVSKRPSFEREFSLTGEIGTDGYALGQLIANGTLIPDTLAGRLAVRWNHFDGDIPNIAAGGKDGGLDIGAARGTLLFTPSDRTEALLSFNYGRDITHSPRWLLRDTPDFPVSATDPRTEVDGESYGVNLRVQHEFDSFILNSQTAFRRDTSTQTLDPTDGLVFGAVTGLPPAYFNIPGADVGITDLAESAFQQEIRLSSLPESPIAWTVGANYFRSDGTAGRDASNLTPTYYNLNGVQDNHFVTNSYAAFGEITLPVTDQLKATFGLRGTHEEKEAHFRFDGKGLPGVVSGFSQDASLSDTFLTGRAALSYEWTPEFTTYASVARGYVTGGFGAYSVNSAYGGPDDPFPASESWTYEAGFKSNLLDERLSLSGSVFFNDVEKGHLVVYDPTATLFSVAALDYQSYGGELELSAKVTPDFDLFGGIGYTHAELRNIPAGDLSGASSGNEVPNVPALTANIGLEYRWSGEAIGLPGNFAGRVTYQYVDSRAANPANTLELKPYNLVNARLTWENDGKSIYAFANNIFDERYEAFGANFGTIPTVRVGQGRVIGIGASLQF